VVSSQGETSNVGAADRHRRYWSSSDFTARPLRTPLGLRPVSYGQCHRQMVGRPQLSDFSLWQAFTKASLLASTSIADAGIGADWPRAHWSGARRRCPGRRPARLQPSAVEHRLYTAQLAKNGFGSGRLGAQGQSARRAGCGKASLIEYRSQGVTTARLPLARSEDAAVLQVWASAATDWHRRQFRPVPGLAPMALTRDWTALARAAAVSPQRWRKREGVRRLQNTAPGDGALHYRRSARQGWRIRQARCFVAASR